MRYYKRLNKTKASNFEYDHNNDTAWSYGWWQISGWVGGLYVFNESYYSATTCKHQSKAQSICPEPDLFLKSTKIGLQSPELALENEILESKIMVDNLIDKIQSPKTHKKKNKERLESIKELKQHIDKCSRLLKKLQSPEVEPEPEPESCNYLISCKCAECLERSPEAEPKTRSYGHLKIIV